MQWMRAAVLATAAAACVAAPRALHAQETQPATAATTAPARTIGTTVPALRTTLSDPAASPPVRLEAARRLLARGTPDARDALRETVAGANAPQPRLAALQALATDLNPDQRLVPDLLRLVTADTDRTTVDAAADALAAYRGDARVIAGLAQATRNPNRPVPLRVPAVRALGTMVEQPAAAALVAIVTEVASPVELANEAGDALVEMTGLEANGRDPAKWADWQKQNANRPAAEWKAALLDARSAREHRRNRSANAAEGEMRILLIRAYSSAPNADKPARLLTYLNGETPEVRRVGIDIAGQIAGGVIGGQNTPEIRARLLELAGDADPVVRLDAIAALYNINTDVEQTLTVLLPQLQVEPDPRVRGAIARKLANVQRIEEALKLLDHSEPEVIREAARALRQRVLALDLPNRDAKRASDLAVYLRQRMTALAGQPRFVEARQACGELLAELKDRESLQFVQQQLFNPKEPAEIRAVGLQILGELGTNAVETIVRRVDGETDPIVRAAGVAALGKTGSTAYFDWLVQKINPRGGEREAEVRRAAREAYVALLPSATPTKLATEANNRRNDYPDLRIATLKEQVRQLQAAGGDANRREAAAAQESIGEEYVKANQFALAVPPLRDALNYFRDAKIGPPVTDKLVRLLVIAMLADKQYGPLATLTQDLFKDPQGERYQGLIGPRIRTEAELLTTRQQFDDAIALTDAALGIDPPLQAIYREDLEAIGKKARAARGSAGN